MSERFIDGHSHPKVVTGMKWQIGLDEEAT